MVKLKPNMIVTCNDTNTFFISDIDTSSEGKERMKGLFVESMSFGVFESDLCNTLRLHLLRQCVSDEYTNKKVIQENSFRDMLLHLDEFLDKYGVEPIIYSVHDKESGEMYIVLIDEELRCVFIDTLNEKFLNISGLHNNLSRQELSSLLQGRNTNYFKIINEFDTVEDALNAPEMFTYKDVLDTL